MWKCWIPKTNLFENTTLLVPLHIYEEIQNLFQPYASPKPVKIIFCRHTFRAWVFFFLLSQNIQGRSCTIKNVFVSHSFSKLKFFKKMAKKPFIKPRSFSPKTMCFLIYFAGSRKKDKLFFNPYYFIILNFWHLFLKLVINYKHSLERKEKNLSFIFYIFTLPYWIINKNLIPDETPPTSSLMKIN